jgi:hypothetical protein
MMMAQVRGDNSQNVYGVKGFGGGKPVYEAVSVDGVGWEKIRCLQCLRELTHSLTPTYPSDIQDNA